MKKYILGIITITALALFLSACGYINSEIYRNKTTSLYNQGKKYYESGEYKKAEEIFRDLVDTDSNHFEGNFALGSSLYMQGNYKEAADYLEAASELDSEHSETVSLLVEALIESDQFDRAEKIVEELPEEIRGKYLTKIKTLQVEMTSRYYLTDNQKLLWNEAKQKFQEQEYEQTGKILEKIVKENQNHIGTGVLLVLTYLKTGKLDLADEQSLKVLNACEGNMTLEAMEKDEKQFIIEEMSETARIAEQAKVMLLSAMLIQQNIGEFRYERRLTKSLKDINVEALNYQVLHKTAELYWRLNNVNEAIKYYELSLSKNADQVRVIDQLAHIYYFRLRNTNKTKEYIDRLIKLEPDNPFAIRLKTALN